MTELKELKSKLNLKQQKFAEEYIKSGNATKSAIKAGYSEKTAATNSTKLLKNTNVAKYIEAIRDEMMDDSILTGREVLYHLSQIATAKVTERDFLVNKKAEYIENENNPDKMQLVYNEHVVMVEKPPKISDRNKALELLGKHHKLFTDVQDVNAQIAPIFEDSIT